MAEKLKAVVAGCGWGRNHMRGFIESDHAALAAIWSHSDKPSNHKLASSYGIPFYTDFDLMLEEIKPAVVSIATPEGSHCKLTVKALNAGAHVYCEKVLATSREEALEMDAAAKANARQLNVGYNYRYSPSCRYFADKIRSGAIGKPLFAMLRAFSCCIHHMTDYVTSLLGEPDKVTAMIDYKLPDGKAQFIKPVTFPTFVYTAMTVKAYMIKYKNGATLLAGATDFSSADSPGAFLIIEGTDGRLELNDLSGDVALYKSSAPFSGNRLKTVYSPSQILDKIGLVENCVISIKDFVDAIQSGNQAPIPAADGIRMIAIEESIRRSAETNRWEPVSI